MPDPHKPDPAVLHDVIDVVLRQCGVNTPDLDRLARLAANMQQIEWQLARRAVTARESATTAGSGG